MTDYVERRNLRTPPNIRVFADLLQKFAVLCVPQPFQHVKSIRHPFLLSIDRVEVIDGELIIVMELADRSLYDPY